MKDKLREYFKKTNVTYPPILYEEWGVTPEQFTTAICEMWDEFPNPLIQDKLFYTDRPNTAKNFEICDTKYKRGQTIRRVEPYALLNQKKDQHISVFKHCDDWVANVELTGSVSCQSTHVSPEYIYLELDGYTIEDSISSAIKIYEDFPIKSALRFYYSGNRSIHIEVNADIFGPILGTQNKTTGIGKLFYNLAHKSANDNIDIYTKTIPETLQVYYDLYGKVESRRNIQQVRKELQSIDPNLFRVNSLIRQPWSYHEKTGKQKTLVSYQDLKAQDLRPKGKNKLAFLNKNSYLPYMMHWTFECYEPKIEYKERKTINNTSLVIKEFSEHLEGFDPSYANERGFVNDLYSPFYEDSNPSVGVNIKTGIYVDFGEPTHSFDFYDFYSKIHNITREEAIKCTQL